MKIAFIVNNYPPRVGGVELHVQALARELAAQGHQPLVVTLGDRHGPSIDQGVEVITLPERLRIANVLGFPPLGTRRRLNRLLRERSVEIVSVHTRFFPMSFIGVRAARRAALPVIHTEHGSDHVKTGSRFVALASRLVDLTIGRWVLRKAERVLSVSDAAASFVWRLARRRASIFYNAVEPPKYDPPHWPNLPKRLVFVGRLVEGKGWETYLNCISALSHQGIDIQGEIFGDGPDLDKVVSKVARMQLNDIVEIRGRAQQSEVRKALRGATLLNPTVLSEGFQTTMLEALAEGGRVVTYPVPGAELLRSRLGPVIITKSKNPEELLRVVTEKLHEPWRPFPPEELSNWTWPTRAKQYVSLCEEVSRQ